MKSRVLFTLLAIAIGSIPAPAAAQSSETERPVSSRVQVTFYPVGGLFATEGDRAGQPSFGSYSPSTALTFQLTRFLAVEGEIGGGVGIEQELNYSGGTFGTATPPSMLNYSGNLVLGLAPSDRAVVPYLAGGVGAVTLLEKRAFGLQDTSSYLAGNLGAGLKAMFGRWGLRADYRLFAIDPGDAPPEFVGTNTRYAHRATVGVVIALSSPRSPIR